MGEATRPSFEARRCEAPQDEVSSKRRKRTPEGPAVVLRTSGIPTALIRVWIELGEELPPVRF